MLSPIAVKVVGDISYCGYYHTITKTVKEMESRYKVVLIGLVQELCHSMVGQIIKEKTALLLLPLIVN